MKSCGPCTLCCKLLAVAEIAKPRERWCVHATKRTGCAIYETRPGSCRVFDCLWLTERSLGPELRPDLVRTVLLGFTDPTGAKALIAVCDRDTPKAWRAEAVLAKLRVAAAGGLEVYAVAGTRCWQVLSDHEVKLERPPFRLDAAAGFGPDPASSGQPTG